MGDDYVLDTQVGFLLRRAWQRNAVLFAETVPGLTPTQFAILIRLHREGPMSQNLLGRSVAMDGATTKGVVGRLIARGLLLTRDDPADRRRHLVALTPEGAAMVAEATGQAAQVSRRQLEVLRPRERATLLRLLARIG